MNAAIKFSVFSILLILLFGFVFAESCTGGEIDYYVKGNLSIQYENGASVTAEDYCFDSSVNVPNGTTLQELLQIAINNNLQIEEQTTGEYLFETTCASETIEGTKTYHAAITHKCSNGCSNGACIQKESCGNAGTRDSFTYCSLDGDWMDQKNENANCENAFECKSELCTNGTCSNPGIIEMIIAWFKALFGFK